MTVAELRADLDLLPDDAEIFDEYGQLLTDSNLFQSYESGDVQFLVQLYFGGSELDRDYETNYTDPTDFLDF